MFRHLLQGWGHEMVDLLIHSRNVIFLYVKCSFSLAGIKEGLTFSSSRAKITIKSCPTQQKWFNLMMRGQKAGWDGLPNGSNP
jgi:hypothetical protein